MNQITEQVLTGLYNDVQSPGSLTSIRKLWLEARKIIPGIKIREVKDFLEGQESYTLHGVIHRKFLKRPVYVKGPGVLLGSDLADVQNLKDSNDGVNFLIFFIDCFSRKLTVTPLKNKSGLTIAKAFDSFLKNSTFRYSLLWVDEGPEYFNKHVKEICKKFNLKMYATFNRRIKSAFAERAILTIKRKLYRALTQFNTKHYLKFIKPIVESYNNSPHRGLLGDTPNRVHKMTDPIQIKLLARKMYEKKFQNYGSAVYKREVLNPNITSEQSVLKEGNYVRLLSNEADLVFSKSYHPIYTQEVFEIDRVIFDTPIVYYLKDLLGERIEGLVYRRELQPTAKPIYFPIEKIIKTRKVKGEKQFLVKYLSYPDHFNEWRKESDIKHLMQNNGI